MKMIIILLFLLMNYNHLNSNIWEETFFSSPDLPKDIECYDNNNCFILTDYASGGSETRIYKTTDAGASWELLNSIKELEVQDMSVPDSNNLFISFNKSIFYKSSDGGDTFEKLLMEGIYTIQYVEMFDKDIGVMANLSILITRDGWKTNSDFKIEIDNMSFAYHYPHFINDSILYSIVIVFDQNVDPQNREPPVDRPIITYHFKHTLMKLNINTLEYELFYIDHLSGIRDFFVLDKQNLFVCGKSHEISGGTGNDAIYKSTDAGKTWRRVLDLYSDKTKFQGHFYSPFGLQSIAFKDSLTGIAVGQFGKIVYTYDGGESWTYESKLPPKLGGGESKPATMLIRYAGTNPIIAAFTGSIHILKEDNLAPSSEHKYSISGRVWEGDNGQAGVAIQLDTFRITMTDKDGYYRFGNLKEGNYQVRALNKYYDGGNPTYYYKPFDYTPLEYNIELTSDTTGFDFNAEDLRTFYKAEGYIVDDKGEGIPDIFLRTGSSTTTTDENGKFEFPKIESRLTFDVIPYSEELTFSPSSHRINLITGDTTDLLFTATPATSVWESANSSSLILHPNPASEYIEIISPSFKRGSGGVKIYNTLGECVIEFPDVQHHGDVGHLQRIDVSHLPRGVYYVRIGSRTLMFVKV